MNLVVFVSSVIDLPEKVIVEHVRVLCLELEFILSKSS
jgi:hypothetical protein